MNNPEPEYTTLAQLIEDAKAGKFDHPRHSIGVACNKCECLALAAQWSRIRETKFKANEHHNYSS